VNGYMVLTDPHLAPHHPPPRLIRDVLADECERVRH
jgi:hypothetical protein